MSHTTTKVPSVVAEHTHGCARQTSCRYDEVRCVINTGSDCKHLCTAFPFVRVRCSLSTSLYELSSLGGKGLRDQGPDCDDKVRLCSEGAPVHRLGEASPSLFTGQLYDSPSYLGKCQDDETFYLKTHISRGTTFENLHRIPMPVPGTHTYELFAWVFPVGGSCVPVLRLDGVISLSTCSAPPHYKMA